MKAHEISFRVYYEDTDAGGVMYHARYLAFAERARTEALRFLKAPVSSLLAKYNLGFVVTKLNATYLKPIHLEDLVTIKTALEALTRVRCTLRQTFERDSIVVYTLKVDIACLDIHTGRPKPIPAQWHLALECLRDS